MTSVQQPGPSQPDAGDCAYNLFRNKQLPEIVCAVPEDCPVPPFIDSKQWTFEQPLRPLEARPLGFNNKAAHTGVRFNGFYLFHTIAAAPGFRATLEFVVGSL